MAIFSTVEVNVGVCCACMPIIYPLFRVLVGRRVDSSAHASSNDPRQIYGEHSSRMRQRLSSCDKVESDTDQLWSTSGGSDGFRKERSDIPLNRIMVTHDLEVDRQPGANHRTDSG